MKPVPRGADFSVLGCAYRIRVLADELARVRDEIKIDRWPDDMPGIVELTEIRSDLTSLATALVFESAGIVSQLRSMSFSGRNGEPDLNDWHEATHLFPRHECKGPDCEQLVPIFENFCDQICAHAAMIEETEDEG